LRRLMAKPIATKSSRRWHPERPGSATSTGAEPQIRQRDRARRLASTPDRSAIPSRENDRRVEGEVRIARLQSRRTKLLIAMTTATMATLSA